MSSSARPRIASTTTARSGLAPLWWLLGIGLVLRLAFLGAESFHNDIAAFEAWTLTLRDNPPWLFYTKTGFADYPPGYLAVLWILAKIYALVGAGDPHYTILRGLVKLPAIAMDLVDAGLVYAVAARFAERRTALVAAALIALNPAVIYVSAAWAQIDAVSWGLVLAALLLVLRSQDAPEKTVPRLTWAWVAFAFSLLMKPQAATVGVLLLAYPFTARDAATRARRLAGTAYGILAGIVLAYVVALAFHGDANPVSLFEWLFSRYAFGSGVYPFTSVNAFNLYAVRYHFWQPDTVPLSLFGFATLPLAQVGIILVAVATALIVWRYLQRGDDRALLEGAMLCALAFFILATRMHERYVYGALLLACPLVAFSRTWLWSALVLTATMGLNLAYSLQYQTVMEVHPPGVDATDLWPWVSHPAALANVVLFFGLGWLYLGALPETAAAPASAGVPVADRVRALLGRARAWFDPREGLAAMTRLDWLIAGGFAAVSFVLCLWHVQYPTDRYFDEVYYPRAGEEYLKHLDVSGWGPFEFTHPPFTKLLIAFSMLMFGGLHGLGDTGWGWRFMNVVVGAVMVLLIYAFAKRLCASTLFASMAAGMLTFDGFHFVQSRISTPEITVAFFALLSLYALYRLWVASQIAVRSIPLRDPALRAGGITMGITLVLAVGLGLLTPYLGPHQLAQNDWGPSIFWSKVVMALYVLGVGWLITRLVVLPRVAVAERRTSYPDGTEIIDRGGKMEALADGRRIPLAGGKRDALVAGGDEVTRTLDRDGTLTYATAVATGRYHPDGTAQIDGAEPLDARAARFWWIALMLAVAFVCDSKWSGLFDLGIVWVVAALVWAQKFRRAPALFGNPFGMPVDLVVVGTWVVGGALYCASYIPYFLIPTATGGRHGFDDMIAMQHAMYRYHTTLVATHPYQSYWYQWPLLLKPISYYWSDTRAITTGPAAATACCVAEILALPNPFVWWFGLATIPILGWLAWRERNKGYALIVGSYFLQWIPWWHSPRLMFEYHFFPNLAMIVLANTVVLQKIWEYGRPEPRELTGPRMAVGAYALVVVVAFVYFYPVLAGVAVPWDQWHARMWLPHWII